MKPTKVLALCTGNRARSIMAEAMFNALPQFEAHSAGSQPKAEPHPIGVAVLSEHGVATDGLRSKSWDEFAADDAGAPCFDVVLTLCDDAAGESCPLWHGAPVHAHWSLTDPADIEGEREAFEATYERLRVRIDRFAALPLGELDGAALAEALNEIGRTTKP